MSFRRNNVSVQVRISESPDQEAWLEGKGVTQKV